LLPPCGDDRRRRRAWRRDHRKACRAVQRDRSAGGAAEAGIDTALAALASFRVSPNAFRAIVTSVAIALAAVSWDAPVNAQTREARVAEISSLNVRALPIEAFDPADRSKKRFGALEFRSGLILTSAFKGFGGLSAIRVGADGANFTALSDKGDWFTGTIVYSGKVMTGLTDVKSAPILGDDGKPIQSKGWFDSESLAFDGPIAYVGLERVNRILRFDFSQGGILSRSEV